MKSFLLPALFLLLFSLLAATRHRFDDFNNAILQRFATPQTQSLTDLAILLADLGNTGGMIVISVIAAGVLVLLQRSRDAVMLAVIMILGGTLNASLKLVFLDTRPDLFASPYPAGGYSFPSGHAQSALALYGTLALLSRRWFIVTPCVVMVLAIGWCRVYLGVHRPTDVLAGFTLAAFVIATAWQARRFFQIFPMPRRMPS